MQTTYDLRSEANTYNLLTEPIQVTYTKALAQFTVFRGLRSHSTVHPNRAADRVRVDPACRDLPRHQLFAEVIL